MSRRKPKIQPNTTVLNEFLDDAIARYHASREQNPEANPTFIAAVALEVKEARVPLMRLREIVNNSKYPASWRHVATYIIDSCRV